MSRATPQTRVLATRLLDDAAQGKTASEPAFAAAFSVCEKLRPPLSMLMGKAGFRAVVARGLAIANAEVPWLAAVQVKEDGSLEGWDRPEVPGDAEELTRGGVLLVAQLLGLLVAFIGDNLTLRLVREVWPHLSLEELNFTKSQEP